ncbi:MULTISPECIES: hypothetical protein [Geobacillus thermoleovorans group]|uniref:hypothetical protein n=1 Tax=Geobacillus thermoleovorans group TaxID=1505648 RepID=UPI000A42B28A|nr:hypothetical protein [Geobacillus kaustophilus]MED4973649.1 hypothetical protein [Geobacillus thermoleovorans]WJQ07657.1 hypothetical protein QT235_03100 [Geobacillus stearothermophilus]WJQ11130.1 hypothetical protein QT237_03015 [Geobacillus stearothermophilus]
MMYWYWKKKAIRPSVFYQIPYGELTIIRAFYELEIEEENEKIKALSGMPCPALLW